MAVYICSKCGTLVESNSIPSGAGCSQGSHLWYKVCSNGSITPKAGTRPYQCRKCGKVIYCSSIPSGAGCPAGGSHLWYPL